MKKLLFLFPIVVLLAAGCNSSNQVSGKFPTVQNTNPTPTQISTPVYSASTTSASESSQASPQSLQIYNGNGFSFKYPKTWQLGYTNYPAKQDPSGCGDGFSDAIMCFGLSPKELKNVGGLGMVGIIVTKTSQTPKVWFNTKLGDYSYQENPVNVNSYPAVFEKNTAGNQYTDYNFVVANKGLLVDFGFRSFEEDQVNANNSPIINDYSKYLPAVQAMVYSIKFNN